MITQELARLASTVEQQMKDLQLWDPAMGPVDTTRTHTFGPGQVSFEQWLQGVFVPAVREAARGGRELPPGSQVATMAAQQWGPWVGRDQRLDALLTTLGEIDAVARTNGSVASPQRAGGAANAVAVRQQLSPLDIDDGPRMVRTVEAVQRHVSEPVRSLAVANRVGSLGRAVSSAVGAGNIFAARRAKKAGGGLPDPALLVATDAQVHVFAFRPTMRSLKVKTRAVSWPRAGVTIAVRPGRLTTLLVLHGAAIPEPVQLEATTIGAQDALAHFVEFVNSSA